MTALKWREVDEIRLTDKLIPHPDSTSDRRRTLRAIRVAVDGPLVHVDPRSTNQGEKRNPREDFEVYAIPAASVEYIRYRVVPSAPRTTAPLTGSGQPAGRPRKPKAPAGSP